jgi:ABC-type polysaccharide/polyol phosphate transport system ATPase subunit
MSAALTFDRVAKHFRGGAGYGSFRDELAALARPLTGRRRPPRRVVEALSDVSFEVPRGGAVALMGANGSGKTTALKLISRITYPTAGTVSVRGRVGALIEVGAGLHPELTGRENVQLYGRILGLTAPDIRRRFASIVEFADIGAAIDQPVKQYSSGMQLRLGFALASHVEPDILLIDEAVSVGDAGFQQRCLERTNQLVQAGTTLLFVSHVPALVASLCRTGILLDRGRICQMGTVDEVIDAYLALVSQPQSVDAEVASPLRVASWDYSFDPTGGRFLGNLRVRVNVTADGAVTNPKFGVALSDGRMGNLVGCNMTLDGYQTGELRGPFTLTCEIRELPLEAGPYAVWVSAMSEEGVSYLLEPLFLGYAMLEDGARSSMALFAGTSGHAPVRAPYRWAVEPAGSPA